MEPRPFTGQRSPRGAGETVTSWPFKDAPSPAALVEMLAHGMDEGMEGQGSRVSSSPLIADWQSDTSSEYDLSSQDQGWSLSSSIDGTANPDSLRSSEQIFIVQAEPSNLSFVSKTEDKQITHLRNRVNELETGLRDAMTLLSTLGDRVRFLEAVVEKFGIDDQRSEQTMNPSAPGRKCQHTASFSALPTPAAAAESPRSSSVVDGDSHDTSICALEEARRSFDPFRPSRDDNAERSSFPEEVEDGATLVSQFGSEQATYSAEDSSVRLHVRPGCLKKGQVAGPIVIETSKKILVECEGLMYLVSVVVNCQPSGSEFRVPLAMDFRLGERMEEHDKGHAESYLEEVKGDLRESYKLLRRNGPHDNWEPVGEEDTDVVYEFGMFFMRARIYHFSQGCLAKRIQLENAIHEDTVTWPSWAPPKKNQLGFVNATNKPLIFLVLPTSWSNQAILSVAMGVAFDGLEASAAISRALEQSILSEATHPQVLQVPCTARREDLKVGQTFPFAICSLPKVARWDARVALITANSDTVEVWDYRIVQQRTWVWVLPGQFSEGMLPLLGRHQRHDLTRGNVCLMHVALMATAKGLEPSNRGAPVSSISSNGTVPG